MALNLKEAIDIIQSGAWFSLSFITADVKKGTGGKVIYLPKARIARRQEKQEKPSDMSPTSVSASTKDPNHSFHFTRNMELPNKQLRKVHPILITSINNQPVI